MTHHGGMSPIFAITENSRTNRRPGMNQSVKLPSTECKTYIRESGEELILETAMTILVAAGQRGRT